MRTVICIIATPVFGGPHMLASRLNVPLRQAGWRLIVLLPKEPGNGHEWLISEGVEVRKASIQRLRKTWNPLVHVRFVCGIVIDIRSIRQEILREKAELVIVCGVLHPYGGIAGRLSAVPVIWQVLSTFAPASLRKLASPLIRLCADVVMSTGESVGRAHPAVPCFGRKWIPFIPPVDVSVFRPDPTARRKGRKQTGITGNEVLVGTVGNFNRQKAHEYLVAAAAIIKTHHSHVRFRLFGSTTPSNVAYYETNVLRQATSKCLLENNFLRFEEARKDLPDLLPTFDIFVLSSISEGLPIAVLEAMACGTPIVATDVGALSEIVIHGVNGYLVPPKEPWALAEALMTLIANPGMRKSMGAQSRKLAVEKFSIEVSLSRYKEAFALALRDAEISEKHSVVTDKQTGRH